MTTEQDDYREMLLTLGAHPAEVAAATTNEQLALLALERLMAPGVARYTEAEVAERTGVETEFARRLWRALGLADPPADEPVFTDADVHALSIVAELLGSGVIQPDLALQMSRVMGSSLARVAEAQIGAAIERARSGGELVVVEVGGMLRVPELLQYVWARQMQATARRRLAVMGHGGDEVPLAVGFADLVGFTALSQQLSDRELAAVVDRFEALAFDTLSSLGGRVVKMIGDEVMFVATDAVAAAEIGLRLSETYADDEELSDVRVGLAWGPALEREGDLFGPTVNLASRIVSIAYAGAVVTSDDFHAALDGDERFEWRSMRRRNLKDIGRVRLWALRRSGHAGDTVPEGPLARARARREVVREQFADKVRARRGGAD